MTPWWLRPPADENPEPAHNPENERPAAISDALAPLPEPEPEPESAEAWPAEAAVSGTTGEDAYDETGAPWPEGEEEESYDDELAAESAEGEEDDAEGELAPPAENGDVAGAPAAGTGGSRRRRSRRRGGRGRGAATAVAAAAPAEAEAEPVRERGRRERMDAPRFERETRPEPVEPAWPAERRGGGAWEPRPEVYYPAPERVVAAEEERKIALFCDFENVALGVRDSEVKKFDINLVLERLLEKGKIIVKRAYADWERYSDYKRALHEAAIELIDIPQKHYSGKNSADIKMVVDAMDLSYSKEHLDTFVILSGDSDFSPLVSKLKENNKYVIGVGVKNSSSNLLIDNCDEFIYYEDVWRSQQRAPQISPAVGRKNAEAFELMVDAILALQRENKDVLWGSMVKQTMKRKKPSFNEGYYGYSTFSELLEDAERQAIIKLKKDPRSGTYIVTFARSR